MKSKRKKRYKQKESCRARIKGKSGGEEGWERTKKLKKGPVCLLRQRMDEQE